MSNGIGGWAMVSADGVFPPQHLVVPGVAAGAVCARCGVVPSAAGGICKPAAAPLVVGDICDACGERCGGDCEILPTDFAPCIGEEPDFPRGEDGQPRRRSGWTG